MPATRDFSSSGPAWLFQICDRFTGSGAGRACHLAKGGSLPGLRFVACGISTNDAKIFSADAALAPRHYFSRDRTRMLLRKLPLHLESAKKTRFASTKADIILTSGFGICIYHVSCSLTDNFDDGLGLIKQGHFVCKAHDFSPHPLHFALKIIRHFTFSSVDRKI